MHVQDREQRRKENRILWIRQLEERNRQKLNDDIALETTVDDLIIFDHVVYPSISEHMANRML